MASTMSVAKGVKLYSITGKNIGVDVTSGISITAKKQTRAALLTRPKQSQPAVEFRVGNGDIVGI